MIQTVKLAKLRLSPINVRTAPDKDLAIEPLAAAIQARGVHRPQLRRGRCSDRADDRARAVCRRDHL